MATKITYKSINGKVIDGKFVHTKRTPPKGYKSMSEKDLEVFCDDMLKNYKNPFSPVNQLTAHLRHLGEHCLKDDLDQGADIKEIFRNSVFVEEAL